MVGLVVALASQGWAGTWVREPGHGYVQLGAAGSLTTHRFTEDGRRLRLIDPHFVPDNFEQVFDGASSWQVESQVYAELGVLPGVELVGAIPVRHAVARWAFAIGSDVLVLRNTAFGDAQAGVRVGGRRGDAVGALAAILRFPLYDNRPERLGNEAGNADIYDDRPPVGPGTVDLDLTASVGTSGARWWAQGEAGVRLRDRQFGILVPLRAQAGARLVPTVAGFVELEAVLPLTDGAAPNDYLDDYNKGPLALDRQSYLRPGLGALWEPTVEQEGSIPGLLVRVDSIVLGRRTSATTTVSASGTLRW